MACGPVRASERPWRACRVSPAPHGPWPRPRKPGRPLPRSGPAPRSRRLATKESRPIALTVHGHIPLRASRWAACNAPLACSLKEAVAAYRAALQEFTRRRPRTGIRSRNGTSPAPLPRSSAGAGRRHPSDSPVVPVRDCRGIQEPTVCARLTAFERALLSVGVYPSGQRKERSKPCPYKLVSACGHAAVRTPSLRTGDPPHNRDPLCPHLNL
jgi:hypothetical protein